MFIWMRSFLLPCVVVVIFAAPQVVLADICWSVSSSGSWSIAFGAACNAMQTPYGLPGGSVIGIVSTIVDWLLALFGILGILGFIISGIMYLLSAGDDDMVKKAKSGLKYSIIGIIVGLSGFVIMQAIDGLLSGVGGNY